MVQTNSIQVSVRVVARPPTVYRFLSEPECFVSWMGENSSIVGNIGGSMSITYPNGDVARGRVLEMKANQRIVFSWGYEGANHRPPAESTRVTIELEKIVEGTLVKLTHESLPSEEERRNHVMGWRHYLAVLASLASQQELSSLIESAVDSYIRAWNEPEAAGRMQHIDRCWENQATYRDPMSYVEGRDHLCEHIGVAQMFAPEARLEMTGGVDHCQGAVRFLWRIKGPGEIVIATGACFGQLSVAGRFSSLVSFWDRPTDDVTTS
jgi:uncharacterized protein YndB with AHSA1/START domain